MNCEAVFIPLNSSRKEGIFVALAQDQMVCLSPAPSFWKEELTFVSSAPCPCLCLPTVWLELPSSHLLSLHSLPWQPSVSVLILLMVTQDRFQAHTSVAACTTMCALTSCEHLKGAVECRESGLFWVPQVHGVYIFPKKYLRLWTLDRQLLKLHFFFPFLTPH